MGQAAASTLFAGRLQQRLAILHRYFIALTRNQPQETRSPTRKKHNAQANLNKQKRYLAELIFSLRK